MPKYQPKDTIKIMSDTTKVEPLNEFVSNFDKNFRRYIKKSFQKIVDHCPREQFRLEQVEVIDEVNVYGCRLFVAPIMKRIDGEETMMSIRISLDFSFNCVLDPNNEECDLLRHTNIEIEVKVIDDYVS